MKDFSLAEFAAITASNEPAPGGGSVSALAAALAAALSEMVAGLTIGREKYKDAEQEMVEMAKEAQIVRLHLLDEVQRDSEAFVQYMKALELPKGTEEEKAARTMAMQEGLKAAARVPLGVARAAVRIIPMAGLAVTKGNKSAVTDGLVAAMMARTAALGAIFNVKINLESIKDEAFNLELNKEAEQLGKSVLEYEKQIWKNSSLHGDWLE